jgi:4-hydroxy-tetrahydrodipicolinate synthase
MELKGVFTALITPFSNGAVDYGKIKELVNMQVEAGVDGIVPVGTTGESPTLAMDEHLLVIEKVIEAANKRCIVMAGTGANSTVEAVELTHAAKKAGADATLQVTPYYNKPTQEGLYRHFSVVAEKGGLPVVLYNVPGRSGVPIDVSTIERLSKNENIAAVKEAGGSAERVSAILDLCEIDILSGDDALTLPMMSLGAKGVISVASNIIPAELKEMVDAFAAGNSAKALEIHKKFYRLFKNLFIETNPIPIKAAMSYKDMIEGEYRLPLCPISEKNGEILKETMREVGIL